MLTILIVAWVFTGHVYWLYRVKLDQEFKEYNLYVLLTVLPICLIGGPIWWFYWNDKIGIKV